MQIREGIEISDKDAELYDEYIEKSAYYNRAQMAAKLGLNSAYGALCNKYFRFFDLRLGSSTTGSGQEILKHQCAQVNKLLVDDYNMYGKATIGGDTDSSYFHTFADNVRDATIIGDHVGKLVNQSFPKFMRDSFFCTDGFDSIIETDREIIGKSSIFVKKKMYLIHVVNDEGKKCDKVKTMGVSLKKTTLPKEFQKQLTVYVDRILKKHPWDAIAKDIVDYKTELTQVDNILRIGLPKGVKNVEKYTNDYKTELKAIDDKINQYQTCRSFEKKEGKEEHWMARLPGHVSASIHWNLALDEINDLDSMKIESGTKLKVYYLKQKYYERFTSIAIPTDMTKVPKWFADEYVNKIDIDAQLYRLIDKSIESILGAIGRPVPTGNSLLRDELLKVDRDGAPLIKKFKKQKYVETEEQLDHIDDLLSF